MRRGSRRKRLEVCEEVKWLSVEISLVTFKFDSHGNIPGPSNRLRNAFIRGRIKYGGSMGGSMCG